MVMNETCDFTVKMIDTISKYEMFSAGMKLLIGVSGGQDSVALLHALHTQCHVLGCTLIAAHINHSFRGEESDADTDYVRDLAVKLGIEYRIIKIDVPAMKKRLHLSSQEAARKARHEALKQIAKETDADRILIAHTLDDRIETMLHNLFRGTGLAGLRGLPSVDLPITRPLIEHSRAETTNYCKVNNLQPRIDSTNTKLEYLRNRTRAELLPYLRTYYNQEVNSALLRLALIAEEESAYLDTLAEEALRDIVEISLPSSISISCSKFESLDLPIRRRVVRGAMKYVRGGLVDISFEITNNLAYALCSISHTSRMLPIFHGEHVVINSNGQVIHIFRKSNESELVPWRYILPAPAEIFLRESKCTVTTQLFQTYGEAKEALFAQSCSYIFKANSISLPLKIRSWHAGDRLRPYGLNGTKKVQDIFTDCKIPRSVRMTIPIITDANSSITLLIGTLVHCDLVLKSMTADMNDNEPGGFLTISIHQCPD